MLAENTKISHYRVLSRIGAGGMGEVYLAEDTRLGRRVALKLLLAQFYGDEDRLRRFEQEARAASALNHPNIITIHEIGSDNGVRFIATEFIEGDTLRQRVRRGPIGLRETIDIALQIAGALAAAHRAGIVHRDIKPENVMLRPDGIVKVLDFGVVKLSETFVEQTTGPQSAGSEEGATPTLGLVTTEANIVMGSPNYMSPEQARGYAVDARTDVFSLGALIYEMLTGRMPFKGDSVSDVIVAILERQPPPLTDYVPDISPKLQALVTKALAKDKEARYQTAEELRDDLRQIKRRLDLESGIDNSLHPRFDQVTTASGGHQPRKTAEEFAVRSDQVATVRATSSAEYIVSEIKRHKRGVLIASTLVLGVVVAVIYLIVSQGTARPIDSIAVLPFANLTTDPDTEYLSEGLTDNIINNLSQSRNLKVMSRNSVFKYKGPETNPEAAGRELGVNSVLIGRITRRGDGLSINVELIDVRDNTHIWGEQYTRKMSDLYTLQQEIARRVSEKLQLRLSGEEERRINKRQTANAEAYELYLRGRFYWNKRTEENLKKGIEYFKQAVEKDPSYALAHAGLSDCYALLIEYSATPTSDLHSKAKAAAMTALDLDPALAEAHTSLAAAHEYEWNWAEAEREYEQAIALNPNYATAHHWYSAYLISRGRLKEAIGYAERARDLDPLSLIINTAVGRALASARRYEEAIDQLLRTIDLDPGFAEAHFHLGLAYEGKGLYDHAIRELEKAVDLFGDGTMRVWIGRVYAESGRKSEALKVLAEMTETSKRDRVPPYGLATLYAALGDTDRAFEWLEKVYDQRSYYVVFLNVDPALDGLRGDARFADLLRRVGYSE